MTRGLRSNGGPSSGSYNNNSKSSSQRDESHGLIEITTTTKTTEDESTQEQPVGDETEATATTTKTIRRTVIRYTNESVNPVATVVKQEDNTAAVATEATEDESSTGAATATGKPQRRPKKALVPHYGDEVKFRIATHKKTGVKRAVELVVTASAKAKLEKEMETKLLTMTRELGVVERMKAGGGFLKCCDRVEELYFPLHEIRAGDEEELIKKAETTGDEASESSEKKPKGKQPGGKKQALREGDEVSFFVYEERDEQDSSRSRPRLTALRVQKVSKGTVTFEELVRANVQGVVSKSPKEPRNGPEVIGSITATTSGTDGENKENVVVPAAETEAPAVVVPGSPKPKSKKPTANKGDSKKKANAGGIPFRLSDAHDMSYSPIVGDVVLFDEVFEKRSGKHKAVNVRVVTLNPKNREQGVITSVREDFGFIKCADRAMDAFFRFGDVMTAHRDFRQGTEVAFDVNYDSTKPENARATRVEILKHGTVQWESVVEDGVLGEVVAVPASSRGGNGGRSGSAKPSSKSSNGRIRLAPSCTKRFWLEFVPELKAKIDALFLLGPGEEAPVVSAFVEQEEQVKEEVQQESEDKTDNKKPKPAKKSSKKEIKLLFPSSLAKAERLAIHEYCDFLGITHQSTGEGPNRKLELIASHKISAKAITEDSDLQALELEFKSDDLAEIRYSAHVGDRVKLKLVRSNRTKQFACKAVTCVEAVAGGPASKSKKKDEKKETNQRDEGFIVSVRSEGFGFIRPADSSTSNNSSNGADENLFFHIKEVTTGETLESLKEGMEVQYTTSFDEVKKKTRALSIAVVPAGTIKKVEPEILKGVVSRPSFLHSMKSAKANRFSKSAAKQATSTVGKIRVVAEGIETEVVAVETGEDEDVDDGEDQDDNATGDEAEAAVETGEVSTTTEPEAKKPKAKKPKTKNKESMFTFNIKDIVDQTVVLREGDEVEFVAIVSSKGMRASKIRVLKRFPKQGVVTKILEDFSGFIRVDAGEGETEAEGDKATGLEIPFLARNVLRGDVLSEGDRVEFAHSLKKPDAARKIGTAAKAAQAEAEAQVAETDAESPATTTTETQEKAEKPEKAFVGQATSVLRLSTGAGSSGDARTRAPRIVNSTLLQAMRQVGASAVVASRMAKGPDGTRGFKDGWRSAAEDSTTAVVEPVASA